MMSMRYAWANGNTVQAGVMTIFFFLLSVLGSAEPQFVRGGYYLAQMVLLENSDIQ